MIEEFLQASKSITRSAYTPKANDTYILDVINSGTTKTSKGNVVSSGNNLTLKPTGSEAGFTIGVNSSGFITKVEGIINYTDNTASSSFAITEINNGPATILEGIWVGEAFGTKARIIFSGKWAVQQYYVDDVWENECDWSLFNYTNTTFTIEDSGDGTPMTINYTLSGTSLTLSFGNDTVTFTKQ